MKITVDTSKNPGLYARLKRTKLGSFADKLDEILYNGVVEKRGGQRVFRVREELSKTEGSTKQTLVEIRDYLYEAALKELLNG